MKMPEPGNTLNRRVWGPWSTAGFGLVVGIGLFITTLIMIGVFVVVRIISGSALGPLQLVETLTTDGLFLAISTFLTAIVCVGLITIFIKIRRGATIVEYLGFKTITRKTILVSLAIITGLIILSDCLSLILGKPLSPEFMVDAYNTSVWPVLLWVALVIFAPAFEESFFRGFLFVGFRQS